MRPPKFEIKRYVRLARGWRYCPPAYGNNNKAKPNLVVIDGKEETFLEDGAYYLSVQGQWVKAGDTMADAQAERTHRIARQQYERATGEKLPDVSNGTPLAVAVARYFSNLEAQGKDPKTIRAYRSAVDPFVAQCKKRFVEEIGKQDLIDFMGWLRRQPVAQRKHGNPERTYANKVGHVAIFLKAFGVSKLLKKSEYPQYEEKTVTAHTEGCTR
jgi:integrase/recombinase XerD